MSIKDFALRSAAHLTESVKAVSDDRTHQGDRVASSPPARVRADVMATMDAERTRAVERAARLEETFGDANPVRAVDPTRVRPSQYANRDQHGLAPNDPEFAKLVASIVHSGRNDCPIIVRPLNAPDADYEIAAGHRRHAAVLLAIAQIDSGELHAAKPTLYAEIRALDDKHLLQAMWAENAEREDLSAWERARTIRMMMEAGGWSQMELAKLTATSQGMISRYMRLLDMPPIVLDALSLDRRRLSVKIPDQLGSELKDDAAGLIARAEAIVESNRKSRKPLSVSAAVAKLQKPVDPTPTDGETDPIKIERTREGTTTITVPSLSAAKAKKLEAIIREWMAQ